MSARLLGKRETALSLGPDAGALLLAAPLTCRCGKVLGSFSPVRSARDRASAFVAAEVGTVGVCIMCSAIFVLAVEGLRPATSDEVVAAIARDAELTETLRDARLVQEIAAGTRQ